MSHECPVEGCWEVPLGSGLDLAPGAQVALEDYARTLAGASAASLVPAQDPARVLCVHLCGTAQPADAVREDVVAFARELAQRGGDGLGWS